MHDQLRICCKSCFFRIFSANDQNLAAFKGIEWNHNLLFLRERIDSGLLYIVQSFLGNCPHNPLVHRFCVQVASLFLHILLSRFFGIKQMLQKPLFTQLSRNRPVLEHPCWHCEIKRNRLQKQTGD